MKDKQHLTCIRREHDPAPNQIEWASFCETLLRSMKSKKSAKARRQYYWMAMACKAQADRDLTRDGCAAGNIDGHICNSTRKSQ